MDLNQVRKDKEQLERDLTKIVNAFTDKYPMLDYSISFETQTYEMDGIVHPTRTIKTKVKLYL